jgi:hypothetical protein
VGRAALALVLLPVWYSGCQAFETRASPDSYYEHDGMWCGHYGLDFEQTRVAVLAALTALQMPVSGEGPLHGGLFIDTRTPENLPARLILMPVGPQRQGTRVCVRVGGFGTHRRTCTRILDEIARHRDEFWQVPVAPTPPPAATPVTPAPTVSQAPTPALEVRNNPSWPMHNRCV